VGHFNVTDANRLVIKPSFANSLRNMWNVAKITFLADDKKKDQARFPNCHELRSSNFTESEELIKSMQGIQTNSNKQSTLKQQPLPSDTKKLSCPSTTHLKLTLEEFTKTAHAHFILSQCLPSSYSTVTAKCSFWWKSSFWTDQRNYLSLPGLQY
jgi:hypothetical protein